MADYFAYGAEALEHLQKVDKKMAGLIAATGLIKRPIFRDPFTSLVRIVISQQLSTKAAATIFAQLLDLLPEVTPQALLALGSPKKSASAENAGEERLEKIRSAGVSSAKARALFALADAVLAGELPLGNLKKMSDDEVKAAICAVKGFGPWSAQMFLIFCLQRPDVFSFGDLALRRNLGRLQGLEAVDEKTFARYAKKYSPYGTVAALYLWAMR